MNQVPREIHSYYLSVPLASSDCCETKNYVCNSEFLGEIAGERQKDRKVGIQINRSDMSTPKQYKYFKN